MSRKHIELAEYFCELLEKDTERAYKELCELRNKYDMDFIYKVVNISHYYVNMGKLLHCVIYMVGDLVYEESIEKNMYGTKNKISEELGIQLLEKLIEYNVDIYSETYYNENALECLNSDSGTKRKNNKKFKNKLMNYYIRELDKTLILKT